MTGPHRTLFICQGTGCVSSKSPGIRAALQDEVDRLGLSEHVSIKLTGCHGFCQQGPIVVVEPEGTFYSQVEIKDAAEIVESHLQNNQQVERLFYKDPVSGEAIPCFRDIPFYSRQERSILRNCGNISPEEIDDYIAAGGYQAIEFTVAIDVRDGGCVRDRRQRMVILVDVAIVRRPGAVGRRALLQGGAAECVFDQRDPAPRVQRCELTAEGQFGSKSI